MRKFALAMLAAGAALAPAAAAAQPAPAAHPPQGHWRHHDGPRMHFEQRRLHPGARIHPFWFGPRFHVRNWQLYGFYQPMPQHRWVRHYDDAYLVDGDGWVRDARYGLDWDRYGERWEEDEGIPRYVGDGDYHPDERDYAWVEGHDGPPAHAGAPYPPPEACGGPHPCGGPAYPAGYGYHGYYGYGCGGCGFTITIVETTTTPVMTRRVVEEVIEERVVHTPRRKTVRRRPPPPPPGERG